MNNPPIRLGRGLGSLLGENAVQEVDRQKIRQIPLDDIRPNPFQPRGQMDETNLAELTASILEKGILQPILVRELAQEPGHFELIAGERRWRAARLAGLRTIPSLVRQFDDSQALEVAILENLQREDLNSIDVARGYNRLIQEFGHSHKSVAQKVGKSRIAVTNHLRLLRLPVLIQDMLARGELSSGHARALLPLEEDEALAIKIAEQVILQELSVRETERLIRNRPMTVEGEGASKVKTHKGVSKDPAIAEMESKLSTQLNTQVDITLRGGKGRIILEYTTPEQLEELTNRLLR
ncbi:MAG: ParB/RepB/Spo0J family partition protein [Magnetococcus sp. DMHC-6]